MITLQNILESNLTMLKEQEAQLLHSLSLVQKAKQIFQLNQGSRIGVAKRGRPSRGASSVLAPKKRGTKAKASKVKTKEKRISHLTKITTILKEKKKPMTSGELIQTLFKQQNKDKKIQHFRLLIYPVLTKAYKSKTLKLKKGKIYLP